MRAQWLSEFLSSVYLLSPFPLEASPALLFQMRSKMAARSLKSSPYHPRVHTPHGGEASLANWSSSAPTAVLSGWDWQLPSPLSATPVLFSAWPSPQFSKCFEVQGLITDPWWKPPISNLKVLNGALGSPHWSQEYRILCIMVQGWVTVIHSSSSNAVVPSRQIFSP